MQHTHTLSLSLSLLLSLSLSLSLSLPQNRMASRAFPGRDKDASGDWSHDRCSIMKHLRRREVDVKLSGKGNSNSHGARSVHLIITMI